MAPKIAIVFVRTESRPRHLSLQANNVVQYSTWGHIKQMAEAEAKGIREAGGECDMFLIPETLSPEVLQKMYAPDKSSWGYPTLDDPKKLEEYDAFLFGIPTRYGNFPAQWKTFFDKTGGQWQQGEFPRSKIRV